MNMYVVFGRDKKGKPEVFSTSNADAAYFAKQQREEQGLFYKVMTMKEEEVEGFKSFLEKN